MLTVTFDSNVWRIVSSPGTFPNERSIAEFKAINAAIVAGRIAPYLVETTFTLEAIKKDDRLSILSAYRGAVALTEEILPDGTSKIVISMGPELGAHPGNNQYLSRHLSDAMGLGFKLLRCPRIAGFKNPDLKQEWFVQQSENDARDRQERGFAALREIEARGCGIGVIKKIGKQYAKGSQAWLEGIGSVPGSESTFVAKAFAEWADGDAVAAHIGYRNTYFCTRDVGNSAGAISVLSPASREWLEASYGVVFVTPEGLAAKLT